MDEYIKREDALDAVLFALVGTGLQSTAIYALRDVPAADVVPKSDVDEIKEEYERLKLEYAGFEAGVKHGIKMFKIKVAREIFEELERIGLVLPYDDYLELKNKYTEEYK